MSILRPIVHAQKHASGRESLDQGVEDRLGFFVDPVKILEDQQQRLRLAFAQEHPLDRAERALPSMSRVERKKWIVGGQDIEQRERRGDRVLQRPIQRQQRPGDLGLHRAGVISSLDSTIGAEQLDRRQVRCRFSIGGGRALEHEPAVGPMRTNELVEKPRLAHPGLADHRDDLAPARAGLLLSLAQLLDFGVASDEACEPARRRSLEPGPHRSGSRDFVHVDRPAKALDVDWSQGPDLDVALGQAQAISRHQNRAWRRELLYPRRQMSRLSDRGVVHPQVAADRSHDHFTRVQADPDLDGHALGAPHFFRVLLDRLLHPERGIARPYGVIFMGERRAEQRHDAVAHHLVDGTLVVMDRLHHPLEDGIENLARLFGVAVSE
jgi:hypothetical protein